MKDIIKSLLLFTIRIFIIIFSVVSFCYIINYIQSKYPEETIFWFLMGMITSLGAFAILICILEPLIKPSKKDKS